MLCADCNHTFGANLVKQLKTDPSIRLALEALKGKLPSFYAKAQNKAPFVGWIDNSGVIKMTHKNGTYQVLPTRLPNGSRVQDTDSAIDGIKKRLTRAQLSPQEINEWEIKLRELEIDTPLVTPTGDEIIKRSLPNRLEPELRGTLVDDRLPALIAFEFLSLLIGQLIHQPEFDGIREYVQGGPQTDRLSVERLGAGDKYDTYHVLFVEPHQSAFHLHIRFFRWLAYRVTFHAFDYRGQDSVYLEDLMTPMSMFAPTLEDAKGGRWLTANN